MTSTTLEAAPTFHAEQRPSRASELAHFLRLRRERIAPEEAGFARGRRRTRGLRREEIAQLAGVSATWYTWLEQARPIRVSEETVESLASALRLTDAERSHLFLLALGRPPADPTPLSLVADGAVQRLVNAVGAMPAYAMGPLFELLAWNAAADSVFSLGTLAPGDRNMLWYIFMHPEARRRLVDWEGNAQRTLARFRADAARMVGDPRMTTLVEKMCAASSHFATWWPRHEILGRPGCRKEIMHPDAGRLVFEHNTLIPNDARGIRIVFYTPLDEDDTPAKLAELTAATRR
ncbi:MAG TPA: helix-turn-helix transcriptional regulator [Gemmatimonadaceae bacterium]|nr:helix-turn-helix transcriptional regulator [Gemmatimonadaceae bacterium]